MNKLFLLFIFWAGSSYATGLAWNPSDASATGYKLMLGHSAGNYTVTTDVGNVLVATVTTPGTWFAAVEAYNAAGVMSGPSNEVSFTVAAPPPTPTPTPKPDKFTIGNFVSVSSAGVNVRSAPAGTLLGTQASGAVGKVLAGPTPAVFNRVSVNWWSISFPTGPSGWVGEDNLTPTSTPTPTPTPTPKPLPTYLKWEASLNTAVAGGSDVTTWISANPPTAD